MIIFNPLKTNNTERYKAFPKGFYTCSKNVGIKDDTLDFSVILSTVPGAAAPIPIGKENIAIGQLRCFVKIKIVKMLMWHRKTKE
ncbi:hypothetical protein P4576_23340 [Peribacillus frigoritolerans]|uniref:hypothetical protein n=1 Tax=Peribacillus frigoritolerans TaxID=450367 RepID=UPI002E1CCC60|nr:hypothetical protein [Peribacillus frigoritolerans]